MAKMDTPTVRGHRSIVDVLLTVAGVTGIAALFMPFVADISPLDVLVKNREDFWVLNALALPAFLPFLIFGASCRWLFSARFSQVERIIMFALSATAASATLFLLSDFLFSLRAFARRFANMKMPSVELVQLAVPITCLATGTYIVIKDARIHGLTGFIPVIAMQAVYVGHTSLVLLGFPWEFLGWGWASLLKDWQFGAWLVLATIVIYLAQIYRATRGRDSEP